MNPINHRMGPAEWAILGILSVLWGGSFFFIEVALRDLPPFTLVLVRVTLAALVLLAVLRVMRQRLPRGRGIWGAFLILALLNNALPFVLFAWGQTQIASGLASILNATTPLWGVVAAHLFTADERLTRGKAAGVLLGLAGVVIMVGSDALAGLGGNVLAQAACLVATLSYALAGVYARRFKTMGVGPMAVSTGQLIAATAILLPIALVAETPWRLAPPDLATVLAMAGLILLSTSLAYWLYFRLLESAGATNSLLVTFLIPITAILLGAIVLGEVLMPKHYAGMALIALGLAAIDGRPFAFLRRDVPT